MIERQLICVTGIVQGVGFRPFVYQQATSLEFVGWVRNDSDGVKIDVQGEKNNLEIFHQRLLESPPPLSRIDSMRCESLAVDNSITGFKILASQESRTASVSISPDQATCPDCKQDMRDETSRYYHYPFTNCTHCGPRYSIIQKLPYDRCNTSMTRFELCPSCQSSYSNPLDRRYHAQPISCPECGPSVSLLTPSGETQGTGKKAIDEAAKVIQQGGVVAMKGLGGFHLICDAKQGSTVHRLRSIKHRQSKPFAVTISDEQLASQHVYGEALEWETLKSQAAPIVLMKRSGQSTLPDCVAPQAPYLGVMLPYTLLHTLLFKALGELGATQELVMTSGNVSGMPLAIDQSEICSQFSTSIDAVLDHNRPIANPCDDSVVHVAGDKVRVLRPARGYAPTTKKISYQGEPILALGAQQKASIAYAVPEQWMLSPYIGDVDNLDTEKRYRATAELLPNLYRQKPRYYLHDLHQGYYSSQYAKEQVEPQRAVQHHYAHILAVMAEHNLAQPVLGFAFDGTGAGDDETVWGGEVLIATPEKYQRVGHLKPFRLLGGEKAIKEPARVLFAMLLECFSLEQIMALNLPVFSKWSEFHFSNLYHLWSSGKNSPYCTSMGRLFDAWAVLLDLVESVDFEGQCGLAIEKNFLEWNDNQSSDNHSKLIFSWSNESTSVLDWTRALKRTLEFRQELGREWGKQVSHSLVIAIVHAIEEMSDRFPNLPVAVSGGVFQNRCLMNQVVKQWKSRQSPIYSGETIPVNDSGIAVGQLWHGLHVFK